MKALMVGCEYVGTSTLMKELVKWSHRVMGEGKGFWGYHGHWTLPDTNGHCTIVTEMDEYNFNTPEEQAQIMALSPKTKELIQRHSLAYHTGPASLRGDGDNLFIGLHIENAIYGRRYYGYFQGETGEFERDYILRHTDMDIMEHDPRFVLILVTASRDAIAERMKANPHPFHQVPEEDIQAVLDEFETEFNESTIATKIKIDTTEGTVEENLAELIEKLEPHFTIKDQTRIVVETARKKGEWV